LRRTLVVTLVLGLLAATHCCAQKVTVDPNVAKPGAVPASPTDPAQPTRYDPAKDPDKRMAEKVSYEAAHARLSTVVAGISQASGVTLACGKSKNDWPMRDIPVTIYAKDVPIGVLLRAVARATHNIVKPEKLNDVIIYRIMQDPKLTRQFVDYENAKTVFRQAAISWNWDSVIALKDIPDAQLQTYDNNLVIRALRINSIRKVSALLNVLGPDYKQRVLNGEPMSLDPKSLPDKAKSAALDVLGACDQLRLRYGMQSASYAWGSQNTEARTNPLSNEELEKVSLTLSTPDSDSVSLYYSLQISMGYPVGIGMPVSAYEFIKPDKKGKRPGPTPPTPPQVAEESPHDLDFADIAGKMSEEFKTKVDMDDWAQKKGLNSAAVMAEMAKRAGFSLVMEDWDYFKQYTNVPQQWLGKGVALEEMRYYYKLRFDPEDKLIVALVGDWANKHEALATASVIDPLTKKIATEAIDLDDILPVMLFTQLQWQEWIQSSKDLDVVCRHINQMRDPLWQFFAMLTPQDRALAATPDGLSMATFKPTVVSDLLTRFGKFRNRQFMYSSNKPSYPAIPDEQGLARLVMRLKSSESPFYSTYTGIVANLPKDKTPPRGLDKTNNYTLYINGSGSEPQTQYADSGGPYQLPFYSKDREAELIKALVGDAKPITPSVKTTPAGAVIKL